MDRIPNARIRGLCSDEGGNEKIGEVVLWWFGWRMISLLRVYGGECAGSRSVGRPRKRWIDIVECLRKRGLDVRQAWRQVQDRCEWRGFVSGSVWGIARGMNP